MAGQAESGGGGTDGESAEQAAASDHEAAPRGAGRRDGRTVRDGAGPPKSVYLMLMTFFPGSGGWGVPWSQSA
ncbi:hypothetical protein San01_55440 [Streptomyces angustmyceticus]|uniref:Uncharacterized protein n=1 Tax=Streptomyces angustmyceticus TaxID=285578 RepID=A0A5J4LN79_9ACTN|nr:hypothetical protein San01_55440 [Streptomyces angustmyceticus]